MAPRAQTSYGSVQGSYSPFRNEIRNGVAGVPARRGVQRFLVSEGRQDTVATPPAAPAQGTEIQRLHCVVSGRVQGVGFRASAIRKGLALGLQGWVRNREDDHVVELVVEGAEEQLQAYLDWLRHTPPPGSRVDGVQHDYSAATGEFTGMDVTSTA